MGCRKSLFHDVTITLGEPTTITLSTQTTVKSKNIRPPHPHPSFTFHPYPSPTRDPHNRRSIIITIPHLNPRTLPPKHVQARYTSVEVVTEVDIQLKGYEHGDIDGGVRVLRGVEWVMMTSSSAGGESSV
jgi:hypothetical protein